MVNLLTVAVKSDGKAIRMMQKGISRNASYDKKESADNLMLREFDSLSVYDLFGIYALLS